MTKTASNKFSFTKGNATYDFNSITINGNAIVDFDSSFQNVTINVKGSTDTTKFLSASSTNFTVNNNDSATGAIWVDGTNEVSLANGTLWSSLNTQSITAGDYTVTPNLESGKAIYLSASSSDRIYIVGDIDPNEAFNVNDTLYTYNPYPVGLTSSDGKVLDPKYYADPGLVNETSKLAVTLGNLIDEANFGTLLSATDGVFSIGSGDNTVTGTVVDDKAKATKQYAQLEKVGFGGYALATIKNASTWDSTNASTIAVAAGANATINTDLVQGKAIFAETSGATFKVIESSGDTFTIDGSNGAPTIENASIINLLGGKITAIQNQTIKLGENTNSPSFVLSSNDGVTITYNKDNSTFNIDGAVGDSFSLGGKEYTVVNGDGMNFIVDSSGNVTVDNLANDYTQDAFTYDGVTYSLRSAGLVRSTVNGTGKNAITYSSLWGGDGNHALSTDSISIAELTTASNWGALATISNGVATILPDSRGNNSVTFVDDSFEIIYGKLERDTDAGNGTYSLTATSDTTETLNAINITTSSGVNGLYMGKTFSSVSILSPNSTVQVAGLESGKESYCVSLYSGGAMGLSGVKNAALLDGKIVLDDKNSDNENLTVSFGDRSIKAGDGTLITLSGTASGNKGIAASDVTITGLDKDESFFLYDISGSHAYTLGGLALMNNKKELLDISQFKPNEENNTVKVSTIIGGDWRGYIAPVDGVLNISSSNRSSVFVVDQEPPSAFLATLTPDDSVGGFNLTTNTEWPSADSIKVEGTTVTLSSAFEGKTILSERSKVAFTVSDMANTTGSFVVKDQSSGAIVSGSPTNTKFTINQKGGTIVASNRNQTISANNYYIAYSSGDCIKVAVNEADGTASIGALNKDDVFNIGSSKYTMTSARRLQTDSKIFNNTISSDLFVPVADLANLSNYNNWSDVITVTGDNFTINGSTTTVLPDSGSALIIDSVEPDKSYGTLTETADGYSLSTVGSSGDTLKGITISKGEKPLSLTSDFSRTTITAVGNGRTTLLAQSPADSIFSVNYQGNYVKVNDVTNVLLARGTIQPSASEQKISANNSVVSDFGFVDEDSLITVMFDGTNVKVGELNDGETFKVGSASYKLVDAIGLIDVTAKKICSSGYDKGVFTVGSNFDTTLLAAKDKVLTIPNVLSESALFVDNVDNPTAKVANLSYGSSRFTLTPYNVDSIDAVSLGSNTTPLITTFDTKVMTGKNSYTFTVNNNAYQAANSALTIRSGTKESGSRLVSGKVSLVAGDVASVRTEDNLVNVTGGDLAFEVAESAVATLSSFSDGDTFVVDGTSYNVAGNNLMNVTDSKIWTDTAYSNIVLDGTSSNGLTKDDNWSFYINIASNGLNIPPTENISAGSWVILSSDKKTRYGTLSSTGTNSYAIETIKGTSWPTSETIRVGDGTTVSLPLGFQYIPIKGAQSGAEFTITENVGFTVTEGTSVTGASIGSATRISQTGGTIALAKGSNQTITATSNGYKVYVPSDNEGDGITVIVNGTSASVGALSVTEPQDSFAVGTNTYKMLPNGSIQRISDKKYWINTIVEDGGAVAIPDLVDKSNDSANWIGYIEIEGDTLTIDETKLTTYNPAFVIDKDDATKIYGKLSRDTASGLYTLDGKNKTSNASLASVVLTSGVQPVSLTTDYYTVPITAGDTQFKVTNATGGGFQINYPSANSLSMSGATEFELIKGKWTLTEPTQILTADSQTVQISKGGGVTVTYQNTADGVNITRQTAKA